MIPNNLVFISCQPHDFYFQWQIEVQIVNFRKFNISDKMQVLVWYPNSADLSNWYKLVKKYPEVKFFFYEDDGVNLSLYIPLLRPHTLKKHFAKFPELKDNVLFYHDSDIIFNRLPDFEKLLNDDVCWQSNTSGYLDYNYLRSKEDQGKIPENEAVAVLAGIGNITVDVIKSYTGKTGGAQYILKGIDSSFWEDVERMCIQIRSKFWHSIEGSVNKKYFPNENAGFQSWCADMWAVNFALWSRGKVTDITDDLDFSWATDTAETYHRKPIFHNAGSTGTNPKIFHKGAWMGRSPIGKEISVDPDTASYFYVEAIKEVK